VFSVFSVVKIFSCLDLVFIMRAAIGIVVFVLILGAVYGLAFVGIIPVQKIADGNPSALRVLKALHLAKSKPLSKPVLAAARPRPAIDAAKNQTPEQPSVDAPKAQLDAGLAQISAGVEQPASAQSSPPAVDERQRLIGIYGTMDPDDLANIFAHISDREAVQDLVSLDEKKAGKVLAALPADRAARLSELMVGITPAPAEVVHGRPFRGNASAQPLIGVQSHLRTAQLPQ
jgi:flagellar motility protein MotE (MotC chaperone)